MDEPLLKKKFSEKVEPEKKIEFNEKGITGLGGRLNLVSSFCFIDLMRKMRIDFGPKVWNFYYSYSKASAMKHAFALLESEDVKKMLTESNLTPAQVFAKFVGLLSTYGFGLILVKEDSLPEGEAFVDLEESSIALSLLEFRGDTSKPVCIYVSAFLAGLASAVYGTEIDCAEQECLATGKPKCIFKLFPSSKSFENIFLEESGMSTEGRE